MLKFIRSLYSQNLSVSIPVFYPRQYVKEIFSVTDRVYVMAYGLKNIERFRHKLNEEMTLNRKKLAIALRCDDFPHELALEEFVDQIHKKFTISRFAFHNLQQYLDLLTGK